MLRITGSATPSEQLHVPSGEELALLQDEFGRRHCLLIPGLFDRPLADEIARQIQGSDFYRREHPGIGVEACMEVNATLAWLLLLVNDERMLEVVKSVSGCEQIGHFEGRVYRLEPSADHHDSWHNDLGEGRLVALSINLGTKRYEGGELQVRDRRTGSSVEVRNANTGDALLFELGEHLEHRVLPVTGGSARTVFAGWFRAGPSFLSMLRSEADPLTAALNRR